MRADGGQLARIDVPDYATESFIAALRKASKIIVTDAEATQDNAKIVGDISLSGAVAALLWIDERQKRLDTPTALVRRGSRPVSAIPAPPFPARVTIAKAVVGPTMFKTRDITTLTDAEGLPVQTVPAAVRAKGFAACRENGDPKPEAGEPKRLRGGQVLYRFDCRAMSDAYNSWSAIVIAQRDKPTAGRLIRLPHAGGATKSGHIPPHHVANGGFNEEQQTLTMLYKSRGLGDCGSAGEWVFDGHEFRLTRYQVMPVCAGLISDDWPVIYRANVIHRIDIRG